MKQSKNDIDLGRFLSLVLRHRPEAIGITLDSCGWADVKELIGKMNSHGKKIDMETLERIVRENNKQRYSFNDDKTKIRANQGHSIKVDMGFTPVTPPDTLYHGTATRFVEAIMAEGITKQSRNHVHLSKDEETAEAVGKRHGKPAILVIDAAKMHSDGNIFYLSDNGVWLCGCVDPKYIKEIKYLK